MEGRLVLLTVAFVALMAVVQFARMGVRREWVRFVHALVALGLAAAGLLGTWPGAEMGLAFVSMTLLMAPVFLARLSVRDTLPGAVARALLPLAWWGAAGRALRQTARAGVLLARGQPGMAEAVVAQLDLSTTPRSVVALVTQVALHSALLARRWTALLDRANRLHELPVARLYAARAMAELGLVGPALAELIGALRFTAIARHWLLFATAEWAAYAVAGDLDALAAALGRQHPCLPQLPPGTADYWMARCLLVRGQYEAAHAAFERARSATNKRDPVAEQIIDAYLRGEVAVVTATRDETYERLRRHLQAEIGRAEAWHAFVAGRVPALVTRVLVVAFALPLLPLLRGDIGLFERIVERFGNNGTRVLAGEWWRLLTAGFLHAGFLHFAFNAAGTLLFAAPLERVWGSGLVGGLFLVASVAGHLLSTVLHPDKTSIGASAGLYGIVGMYVLTVLRLPGPTPARERAQRFRFLVAVVVLDFAISMSVPVIDTAGHAGGLLAGLLIALYWTTHHRPRWPRPRPPLRRPLPPVH